MMLREIKQELVDPECLKLQFTMGMLMNKFAMNYDAEILY